MCSTFPYRDFLIPSRPLWCTLHPGFLLWGWFLTWWICHQFKIVLPVQLLVTLSSITINSLITCQAKTSLVKIITTSPGYMEWQLTPFHTTESCALPASLSFFSPHLPASTVSFVLKSVWYVESQRQESRLPSSYNLSICRVATMVVQLSPTTLLSQKYSLDLDEQHLSRLLLSLSEILSALRNLPCLMRSHVLINKLGNLFLLPEKQPKWNNIFCHWIFKEGCRPELWPGWKIAMSK